MDAKGFFDHDILELPKSWEKEPLPFHKYLRKIYDEFNIVLDSVDGTDFISLQIVNKKNLIKNLGNSLIDIIEKYLKGELIDAYQSLDTALRTIRPYIQSLIAESVSEREFRYLFRIRLGNNYDFRRKDLFHTPFELRHKISTKRYSIPGLPTLYLGGSIFICWEEMNRPDFTKIHASRFSVANGETLKVLDFGYRPAHIAVYINNRNIAQQLSHQSKESDFAIAQAVCWPLIAACSIVTREKEAPFKPEYILPQLMLQWVTKHKEIDGIRYFSSRVIGNYDYFKFFLNYAFPVKSLKDEEYCDYLKNKFLLTEPLHWSLAESFSMGGNPTINAHVHIELLNGEEVSYMNSKFETFEDKLCGMHMDRIP